MNRLPTNVRRRVLGSTESLIVVAAALAGALLGLAFVRSQPERFTAQTVVAVAPAATVADAGELVDIVGSLDSSGIPATVAGMATSDSVVQTAAGLIPMTSEELADYDVDATPVVTANLVEIRVTGPDSKTAADLTNAVASEVQSQFVQLYRVYEVKTLTPANAPAKSDRPSASLVMFGSAALAGVVALWIVTRRTAHSRAPAVRAVGS